MPRRRRHSTIRLLRAIWRYRGRLEAHGDEYQTELAVTLRTALDSNLLGRPALAGYRAAMRTLVVLAGALAVGALLVAAALWFLTPWLALVALLPLLAAGVLGWLRLGWGAPLDWLEEHDDPARQLGVSELPQRLHALARETRSIANVPARLADELDALADEVDAARFGS